MASAPLYPAFVFSLFEQFANRGTIAYKILGAPNPEVTPLVLIHGLSAVGLVDWSPLAEKLAEQRQVLIFDNRHIGFSTLPKEKQNDAYNVQDMAEDVIELVKHVGWKQIDVLGFSMGGMIAQTLLVTPNLPFKITHAILAATSAKAAHSDLLSAIPTSAKPNMTFAEKKDLVRPFIYIGYDEKFLKDPKNAELLERRVEESVRTRRPSKTVAKQLQVIAKYDVRAKLSLIPATLPVLIIHGTKDRSVYPSEQKYIEKGIKHVRIAKLPNGGEMGHMWYDYFGDVFWAALIGDFLDGRGQRGVWEAGKAKL